MPPKSWFQAAGAATAKTNSVLDDAPALPGADAPARAPHQLKSAKKPHSANAWTGQLDSRAEAAQSALSTAPELQSTPPQPAASPAAAPATPPAAAAARPGTGGGRGRGRGRGAGAEGPRPTLVASPLPYLEINERRDPAADILSAEQPRASLQAAEVTAVSKKLSQVLRHGALEQGFPISKNGYVAVSAILGHPKFKQVTRATIAKVVVENGKQRFKLAYGAKDGEVYIRANQGHSMEGIEVDMHRITDPAEVPVAIHGTKLDVWPKILASGLNRMGRQHVHMAVDVPGSQKVISGARASSTCMVYVDIAAMVKDGLEVLVSSNGVVLSAGIDGIIPPKYFVKADDNRGQTIWRP